MLGILVGTERCVGDLHSNSTSRKDQTPLLAAHSFQVLSMHQQRSHFQLSNAETSMYSEYVIMMCSPMVDRCRVRAPARAQPAPKSANTHAEACTNSIAASRS
eukprot:6175374-Pleurochrysis_carterae.AAC.3